MTTGTKLQYPMVLSSFSPHSLKNKKVDTEESNQYKTLITCSENSDLPSCSYLDPQNKAVATAKGTWVADEDHSADLEAREVPGILRDWP